MLRLVRSLVELTSSRGKKRSAEGFFLPAERFELAIAAERMRVDRNSSVVSLLVIEPANGKNSPRDIHELERQMAARLRLTDTAGWMRDSRLGVLLPDTAESGAWKVAEDLCELYPAGPARPTCEVLVYPDNDRPDGGGPDDDPKGPPSITVGGGTDDTDRFVALAPGPGVASSESFDPSQQALKACSDFDSLLARPIPRWKRAIDIAGAATGLLVASPFIAAAAVAVRLTSEGPAFFFQEREGFGGHRFRMVKLRTMRPDAEAMKASLLDSSEQDGPAFKMRNDPRVTPIGGILRKTSLDELPQLWNVLWGDMSLVGPRPLPVAESQACKPWQRRRLLVTPGLTCIWQIYGRNVVPFDEWVRMDLDYAKNRSPWLDLKLVAKTGPTLIQQKGR